MAHFGSMSLQFALGLSFSSALTDRLAWSAPSGLRNVAGDHCKILVTGGYASLGYSEWLGRLVNPVWLQQK